MVKYAAFAIVLASHAFADSDADEILSKVEAIHGNAGVFAVVGYRIGETALKELGLPRGSFAIDVVHHTPLEVQYSCIADGVQAATGASSGKLNLHVVQATAANLETVIRDRKTGRAVMFHLQPAFLRNYLNLPYEKQPAAARKVLLTPAEQIFSVTTKP